jgi:hypothetical protein
MLIGAPMARIGDVDEDLPGEVRKPASLARFPPRDALLSLRGAALPWRLLAVE